MWERASTLQRTPYLIEDSLPAIRWQTYPQTKVLDGSTEVQRARGQYRGRWYTAWFAPSLPLPHGPWKLGGLPGLILEAYDDEREVVFLFQGLRTVKRLTIAQDVADGEALSPQTYLKIKERELRQFLEYVQTRLSSCHPDLDIRLQYSYKFWEDPP
jgi:GLPGLI family protein